MKSRNLKQIQKHVRELELEKDFFELLELMPNALWCNFYNAISSRLGNAHIEFRRQVSLKQENENYRFDVTSPQMKEIIFELKISDQSNGQLENYAKIRSEAIIVSLAKSHEHADTKGKNIVKIRWHDFFWAWINHLPVDARERIAHTKLNSDFYIEPINHNAGGAFYFLLERFLKAISGYAINNSARLLVVTGQDAKTSLTKNNIYFCPSSWSMDFKYICCVYNKKICYIGEIIKSAFNVAYEDGKFIEKIEDYVANLEARQIADFNEVVNSNDRGESGFVGWLEPSEFSSLLDKEYKGKGPFTQSHRYFDSIDEFKSVFLDQNG